MQKFLIVLLAGFIFAGSQSGPQSGAQTSAAMTERCCPAQASQEKRQALWQKMQARINEIDRNLTGFMGVAVLDLTDGRKFLWHGDEVFPQASAIKIAVLAELYHQEQQAQAGTAGKQRLANLYTVRAEDLVADSDIMLGLTPGVTRVTNRDLATMMIAVSDNSAANVLIGRLGFDNVNALLAGMGLKNTRLQRKMMDLKAASEGKENLATPREMMTLLESIYHGKVLNRPLADDFFKMLSTAYSQNSKRSHMVEGIPPGVVVAEKSGELEAVRNDSGVIFAPNRPFVLCVMTTYLKDERDGERAITQAASAAFDYFDIMGRASQFGRVVSPRNSR